MNEPPEPDLLAPRALAARSPAVLLGAGEVPPGPLIVENREDRLR
jgi:hypothetical protein